MKLAEKEMRRLENQSPFLARLAGSSAFKEVMASGRSVLVAKNDNIVEVFPSGEERIVGVLKRLNECEGVSVFITSDAEFLKQYYKMRHEVYCVENGWINYPSDENDFDRKGKIIVAVSDGKVVGGMRLLTSRLVEYFSNEVLGSKFTYKTFLKESGLVDDAIISEISAFFVERRYRNSTLSRVMIGCALEEARNQGCIYNINILTPLLCRSYRKDVVHLGYKAEIYYSYSWIPQEPYNNLASWPIVVFLDQSSQR